jgi:hypothetical protein
MKRVEEEREEEEFAVIEKDSKQIHHLQKQRRSFLPVRKIEKLCFQARDYNTIIIITHYYSPVVSHVTYRN